jgi:predicted alpha-1,6-mannanase (GH76 family)
VSSLFSADARADVAQRSLDHFWGAPQPQLLDNVHPLGDDDDNRTFNYWWLAHVIDCRLDAYERTGDASWRAAAELALANLVERNGGSLFNDYFDDMLWLGLAALRLADLGAGEGYRAAAVELWDHVAEHGWNPTLGESLAWRKQQLDYKNTPANGPFIILALRLSRALGDERFRELAERSYNWLTDTLVDPATGFVEDGINREGDGRIDTQWRFSYNQGLYIGASVELFEATGNPDHLESARRTARTAIEQLSDGTVFVDEGDGGDEGLFKGVFFRYLRPLLAHLDDQERAFHEAFLDAATATLWRSSFDGEWLRAGNDWRQSPEGRVAYSTQLSAIMALELQAAIADGRVPRR